MSLNEIKVESYSVDLLVRTGFDSVYYLYSNLKSKIQSKASTRVIPHYTSPHPYTYTQMPPKKNNKKGKKGGDDDEEYWSVFVDRCH